MTKNNKSTSKPVVQPIDRPDLTAIKVKDSNLDALACCISKGQNDSLKQDVISKYFDGKPYSKQFMLGCSPYMNTKIQWVMMNVFKDAGLEIIKESNFGLNEEPPTTFDAEIDVGVSIKMYQEVVFFLWNATKKTRSIVDINFEAYDNRYHFYVYGEDAEEIRSLIKVWKEVADKNNPYRGKKVSADGRLLNLSDVNWEDVILESDKLDLIKTTVVGSFRDASLYRKFGVSMKRGIILHGPPGTGKTQICKAIAKGADCSVVYALPQDFDERKGGIRGVCSMVKDLAPCVFIIEDIDWIAKNRDEGNTVFVMELMNQLDGLESFGDIVTVGTTNCAGDIEKAVKNRPGRFDRSIEIGNPSLSCRERMIREFTKKFILQDVKVKEISEKMDGLSGAHVRDLCTTAAMFAIRDHSMSENQEKLIVKQKHFSDAVKEVKRKDYSSYQEVQNAKNRKPVGFGVGAQSHSLDDLDGML